MENLTIEKIKYYREHPEKFVEECFNIKLMPYQKKIIKDNRDKYYITRYVSYNKIFWNSFMTLVQSEKEQQNERDNT